MCQQNCIEKSTNVNDGQGEPESPSATTVVLWQGYLILNHRAEGLGSGKASVYQGEREPLKAGSSAGAAGWLAGFPKGRSTLSGIRSR